MRPIFFLLLLLITTPALSCNTNSLEAGGEVSCVTLQTDAPLLLSNMTITTGPLVVRVSGNVDIDHDILIMGVDGASVGNIFIGEPDNQGGPGAGTGGGYDIGTSEQDGLPINYGGSAAAPADCSSGGKDVEGGGGGGGSLGAAGDSGISGTHNTGADSVGIGGAAGPNTSNFNWNSSLNFGGAGGGSGSTGCDATAGPGSPDPQFDRPGTGGGGGGSIHIIAGGNININAGVTINVSGGAGGVGVRYGGGGGGGSGGVIWLQSAGQITVNGTLLANGGAAGTADPAPVPVASADGGQGGRGLIRLEDIDGIILGAGVPGFASSAVRSVGGARNDFKSSISCGTVKTIGNENLYNMALGLSLAFVFGMLFRKKRKSLNNI